MAPDPRVVWVAMPPLHLPPRRRQALGAGKGKKSRALASSQTLLENAAQSSRALPSSLWSFPQQSPLLVA